MSHESQMAFQVLNIKVADVPRQIMDVLASAASQVQEIQDYILL